MTDLIERLRNYRTYDDFGHVEHDICDEAADALTAYQGRVERLEQLGSALVEAIDGMIEDTDPLFRERPYSGRQIGEQLKAFRAELSTAVDGKD